MHNLYTTNCSDLELSTKCNVTNAKYLAISLINYFAIAFIHGDPKIILFFTFISQCFQHIHIASTHMTSKSITVDKNHLMVGRQLFSLLFVIVIVLQCIKASYGNNFTLGCSREC